MEYYLGTYSDLKWYGWKFFEKYKLQELCELYKKVYECWHEVFNVKKYLKSANGETYNDIAKLLREAYEYEKQILLTI